MKFSGWVKIVFKMALLITGLTMFCLLSDGNDLALWARLFHQIYAVNETWWKIWQSLPKARRIFVAADYSDIASRLIPECERTWNTEVRWDDVEGMGVSGQVARTCHLTKPTEAISRV